MYLSSIEGEIKTALWCVAKLCLFRQTLPRKLMGEGIIPLQIKRVFVFERYYISYVPSYYVLLLLKNRISYVFVVKQV